MKCIRILTALLAISAAPSLASPRPWNADQTSAWAFVTDAWQRHADPGTWYQAMDPHFFGWTTGYPVPTDRLTHRRRAEIFGAEGQILFHRLDPLAVTISGDTAVAYYFAEIVEKNHEGTRKTSVQRCSNTLVRTRGEWSILGWMCDTKTEG
jgi:hypothetical protein